MAHFAKIEDGIVTQKIVAEEDYIKTLPGEWVQTSYNTVAGVHSNGGTPLRKNFAVTGYTYDKDRDAFYAPQPYPSWTLDEDTCTWKPPTPMPDRPGKGTDDDQFYIWNEDTKAWDEDKRD